MLYIERHQYHRRRAMLPRRLSSAGGRGIVVLLLMPSRVDEMDVKFNWPRASLRLYAWADAAFKFLNAVRLGVILHLHWLASSPLEAGSAGTQRNTAMICAAARQGHPGGALAFRLWRRKPAPGPHHWRAGHGRTGSGGRSGRSSS